MEGNQLGTLHSVISGRGSGDIPAIWTRPQSPESRNLLEADGHRDCVRILVCGKPDRYRVLC
jgi:hypothetical protein